tara:strand:- start:1440 stop:3281 length:1842 start_codon:yes stop_codon:yes gene_type:complete
MDDNTRLLKDWYLEYAIGSVANRMSICKVSDFPSIIQDNIGREIYRSMFMYDESVLDFVSKEETISGFQGDRWIDKIVLDIDMKGKSKGDETVQNVLKLIDRLNEKGVGNELINVWFSGTGFHIHIPNVYQFESSSKLDKTVRASIQRDFGEYIDLIYDATRLIRAGYSFNLKTDRYKNPISIKELEELSYEKIKDMCKEPRKDFQHKKLEYDNTQLLVPMDISRKNIVEYREVFKDAKAETSRYITCAQHLYNDGEVAMHRHHNLLRLVSVAIGKFGFDIPAVQGICTAYMKKFNNPLPATEVSKIIVDAYKVGGYKYSCQDVVLAKYCDPKCVLYRFKNLEETTSVLNAEQMVDLMLEYVNTDFTNKSFDLKKIFPYMGTDSVMIKTGQLAVLVGDTKLGKTAFWQHVASSIPDVKVLFMSLEVDKETMARRFMQQALKLSKKDVNDRLKQRDLKSIETIKRKMSHIQLLTDSPDITKYPELIQEHKPKVVIVDTLDMVPARYSKQDEVQKQVYIIKELKRIAVSEDVIILAVSHISKGAHYRMKEGETMDIYDAKGTSSIAQQADMVIGFMGERDTTKKRIIKTLGARDESGFTVVCNYDWETFTFSKRV